MLTHTFSDQVEAIERLRAQDDTFAEICRDYETLAGMLPRDATDPSLLDIQDSLRGLEDEIRTYLARAGARLKHFDDARPRREEP